MKPFSLLIKPAGPDCNLQCDYCFYLGKQSMFGPGPHRMSEEILEKLVSDYLGLNFANSSFAFQGGEPTLMGLDFFRKVVALQEKYGSDGQQVSNALQTNATLLTDEWFPFLREYNFLLGISLDGPRDYHDRYRHDRSGNGCWERVTETIEKCRQHRVEFNILVLLNNLNAVHPDELFDYFTEQKIRFLQFIPGLEFNAETGKFAEFSVSPQQYGDFLCRIFDRWLEYGPEKLSVRLFDSILNFYVHGRHTNCTFGNRCDDYVVVEHNGDVFCCDFFVEDRYRLGNLMKTPLDELSNSVVKRDFARLKRKLPNACIVCRHHAICRGGCPKDRLGGEDESRRINYFCPSYKQFFDHALPRLREIAATL